MRFAPFVETGEFANAGIVLMAADRGYFGFELETRRYKRITQFFDDMDSRLYRQSIKELRVELGRIQALIKRHGTAFDPGAGINTLFEELIRPRESIVRFSDPRIVLAESPEKKLKTLHQYYVHRSFATPEHRETVLARGLGRWLKEVHASARFTSARLGNDEYETPELPFVEQRDGRAFKVMKPLNLDQATPSAILEHANRWQFRLAELRRRRLFDGRFLFAVEGPSDNDKRYNAFDDARGLLAHANADIVDYADKPAILDFALRD
ncbi:hypothetical protein SAHL_02900 [Salinisphaera orenii YIM 95161]|uniref:DUF3037 domain-containing protein n=1 Tax=Salinisphaera orenii YIM 95161 TaxID=1051139 RepID=A0A423Q6E7_9GAMM|nr:hypothetical protein SAHL_02900 [Salinisphaera halophila YIM 95161]